MCTWDPPNTSSAPTVGTIHLLLSPSGGSQAPGTPKAPRSLPRSWCGSPQRPLREPQSVCRVAHAQLAVAVAAAGPRVPHRRHRHRVPAAAGHHDDAIPNRDHLRHPRQPPPLLTVRMTPAHPWYVGRGDDKCGGEVVYSIQDIRQLLSVQPGEMKRWLTTSQMGCV